MENPNNAAHQIEFLTPFDLNACKSRLEGLNEKGTFFAFDWQFRIKTQVWKADASSATFKLHYIQKSYMEFTIAPVVALRGALQAQSDGSTQVAGAVLTNWIGYAISCGITGLMLGLWPATILAAAGYILPAVLIFMLVPGIVFWVSRYWLDWRKNQLLGVLTDTFGGQPVS